MQERKHTDRQTDATDQHTCQKKLFFLPSNKQRTEVINILTKSLDFVSNKKNRLTNILEKSSILQVTRRRCHAEHDACKIHKTNLTSKIIGGFIKWPNMQIIFKFQVNRMKIDDFRNSAYVDLLADVDLKNNWLLNLVTWYENPIQSSSQWDERWGFSKYNLRCWSWAYVDALVHVDLKIIGWLNSANWNITYLQISSQLDENWGF